MPNLLIMHGFEKVTKQIEQHYCRLHFKLLVSMYHALSSYHITYHLYNSVL
ncbi:MAG: hypothetical protein ACI8RD_006423 [Bacillariaceae sp.]|jgi:hypothetical protein